MNNEFSPIVEDFAELGLEIKQYQNYLRGNCPFRENHDDKSDGSNSFFLHPSKNAYHCFSCGAHGNASRLLLKIIGSSFADVMKLITQSVSDMVLPPKTENDLIKVGDAPKIIAFSSPPENYLERGYDLETLKKFKVGGEVTDKSEYCVHIPFFLDEERTQPITVKSVHYDILSTGRFVRKYAVYDPKLPKGFLYNLPSVKGSAVILVEGESDVWRLSQYGYDNVVSLGTSNMSEEQADLLSVFSSIYIMLDTDWAGIKGTEVIYSRLKEYQMHIFFCMLDSPDPGDSGRREVIRSIREARNYLAYSMEQSLKHGEKYIELKTRYGN